MIHVSDQTDESTTADHCLDNLGTQSDIKILGHFMDALDTMAKSLADLKDSYFKCCAFPHDNQ